MKTSYIKGSVRTLVDYAKSKYKDRDIRIIDAFGVIDDKLRIVNHKGIAIKKEESDKGGNSE